VLGVLFISNEYANGMIRSTFAAVPRRLPVLWAKALVLFGVLAGLMVVATLASFLVGQAILGDGKNTTLAADGVLRAVLGAGLYLTGIGVLGIAVGALMRNTAGAISIVVATLLIIPGLARLILPEDWNTTLTPYLPSNAGSVLIDGAFGVAHPLSPLTGFAVMSGYAIALIGLAAWRLHHADA